MFDGRILIDTEEGAIVGSVPSEVRVVYKEVSVDEVRKLAESQSVEVKKSLSLQKEGLRALAGMVNTDTGKGLVIFGIGPDCEIVGVEPGDLDSAQRTLAQRIRDGIEPPLVCSIEVLLCSGKNLLAVHAERAGDTPYHEFEGRAFIREGTTTRQLSLGEKQSLARRRDRDQHNGPWKCNKCGTVVVMLFSFTISGQVVGRSYKCDCGGEYWPLF